MCYGVILMSLSNTGFSFCSGRLRAAGFPVCASFFLFGALVGTLSANYIPSDKVLSLGRLLMEEGGVLYGGKSLFEVFLAAVPFHFAAFLLGFVIPGFLLLPLISCLKGFFLSLSAAAAVRALGKGGFFVAFFRFGLPSIIALPCFFILAVQSFNSSLELTSGVLYRKSLRYVYDKAFFLRSLYCFAALFCSAVIEAYALPVLAAIIFKVN